MERLLFIVLFPFLLSAQSEFFDKTTFGIKTDYILVVNEDFTGMGVGAGISLFNSIDIRIEYIKTSYYQYKSTETFNRLIYAAYNFRSYNTFMKVFFGYSHYSFDSKPFYYLAQELTGPMLGFVISPKIFENNSIVLIPGVKVAMIFLSPTSGKDDDRNHNINMGLEFNALLKVNEKFSFAFTPTVSVSLSQLKVPLIYGVNLGVLYNVPNK